jgi:hypothetical protein
MSGEASNRMASQTAIRLAHRAATIDAILPTADMLGWGTGCVNPEPHYVGLCIPTPPRIARRSHLAVSAFYGLADGWGRDLVGYLDVPDFAFALRAKVRE